MSRGHRSTNQVYGELWSTGVLISGIVCSSSVHISMHVNSNQKLMAFPKHFNENTLTASVLRGPL